jgi:hypothetical protein
MGLCPGHRLRSILNSPHLEGSGCHQVPDVPPVVIPEDSRPFWSLAEDLPGTRRTCCANLGSSCTRPNRSTRAAVCPRTRWRGTWACWRTKEVPSSLLTWWQPRRRYPRCTRSCPSCSRGSALLLPHTACTRRRCPWGPGPHALLKPAEVQTPSVRHLRRRR